MKRHRFLFLLTLALGAVLVRLGRTNEGIGELERALAIQPSDSSAQLNLALAYEQSGQAAKALPLFQKLEAAAHTAKHALSPAVLASFARAFAATGQLQPAITKMKEAAVREPKNFESQDDLGSLYAKLQDWPNAKLAFSAALVIRPDSANRPK